MQQLTFPKFLILAVATYLTVTGKTCEWFRSLRHGIRHQIHSSQIGGGFHLRKSHHVSQHATNNDNNGASSIELLNEIVNAPPLGQDEEEKELEELLAEMSMDETVA